MSATALQTFDPLIRVRAAARSWREQQRRPAQCEPEGDWRVWMIISGRGWGKTRVGCETIRHWVNTGKCREVHMIARTAKDARDTMIQGESGLLACCRFDVGNIPEYFPSTCQVIWPSGARARVYTAETPDALRGPQCDAWWADEVASWEKPQETWDMLQMGARLGDWVRGVVTTTPRPIPLIKNLIERDSVVVTRGSSHENFDNLARSYREELLENYEGTRLGRQELHGEILIDNPHALWTEADIEAGRVTEAPDLVRVVVAVDPAATDNEDSDETGIVVAGRGGDGQWYVLADRSLRGSPQRWGQAVVNAYEDFNADRVIYEANQGGDMVKHVLRTVRPGLPISSVYASRGKWVRAEPVAALYEQHRVHHVGRFPDLEKQLVEWDRQMGYSPDRLDALVWAISSIAKPGAGMVGVSREMIGI